MFFISAAYAGDAAANMPEPASPGEALTMNILLLLIFVGIYILLVVRPQQKRFKEHRNMLSEIQKGTKVVTGGGIVCKVVKIIDEDEMIVEMGGSEVTILRSTIMGRYDDMVVKNAANENDKKKDKDKNKK